MRIVCRDCSHSMERTRELSKAASVRLDICDRCRLIWLDPQELDKIPKVPVEEEDALPPDVRQAITRAQVALLNTAYDAREDAVHAPFVETIAVFLCALLGFHPRRG